MSRVGLLSCGLALATMVAGCNGGSSTMKNGTSIDDQESFGRTPPSMIQTADRDIYPPDSCDPSLAAALPEGIEVWSCRPGQFRFVERPATPPEPDLANYEQQRNVHYLVVENAIELLADLRSEIDYRIRERDLAAVVGPALGLSASDNMLIRGATFQNGHVAGWTVYLLDQQQGLLCEASVPNVPNPSTTCRLAAGPHMLEVQLPNRELQRLGIYLSHARQLARLMEDH